jgi:hypothetical protein
MIRIYENEEIPKGWRDTLKLNKIDIDTVKYVLDEDYGQNIIHDVLKNFEYYQAVPTILDSWIYVIYE